MDVFAYGCLILQDNVCYHRRQTGCFCLKCPCVKLAVYFLFFLFWTFLQYAFMWVPNFSTHTLFCDSKNTGSPWTWNHTGEFLLDLTHTHTHNVFVSDKIVEIQHLKKIENSFNLNRSHRICVNTVEPPSHTKSVGLHKHSMFRHKVYYSEQKCLYWVDNGPAYFLLVVLQRWWDSSNHLHPAPKEKFPQKYAYLVPYSQSV